MIKILFVDDNFDCLKILERVFRKEFIVYTTSGVNAADRKSTRLNSSH